jgi:hypothetical protein
MFNDFGDGFTIIDRSKNLPSHCSSSKLWIGQETTLTFAHLTDFDFW